MGISSHALDELNGRPLGTRLSNPTLVGLAVVGLAGAVAIGVVGAATVSASLVPLILAGAFIVVAYNLELFGGRFHSDLWFAAAWGGFPAATAYWVNALSIGWAGVLASAACVALSLAQRRLSTPVRELRRKTASLTGEQRMKDGSMIELSPATVARPLDGALRALSAAVVLLAGALLVVRL